MNKNELIIKLIGLRISLGLQSSGMSKDLANKQAREGIQKLYNTPEQVLGTEEGTIVTIIETYMNSLLPYLVALGGENQDGGELDSNFQKANDDIISQIENHRNIRCLGAANYPKNIDDYVYYRLSLELKTEKNSNMDDIGLTNEVVKKLTHSAKGSYMRNEVKEGNAAGSKKCFVATVCFGTPDDPTVIIMRNFRDNVLLNTKMGSSFVRWYYRNGQSLADFVSKRRILKSIINKILKLLGLVIAKIYRF